MSKGGERIVILGAGFGGLVTAVSVARRSPHTEVVLLDAGERHVYSPWLYEVVTGMLDDDRAKTERALVESASFSLKEFGKYFSNLHVRHARVEGCDFSSAHVKLEGGGTIAYDKLVIALGSSSAFFGIPGLQKYGWTVKGIEGAIAIRQALMTVMKKKHVTVVVGGAGATGVETAAELAHFCRRSGRAECMRIVLIDADMDPLGRFPKSMQVSAAKRLAKLGVEQMLNTKITKATAARVELLTGKEAHEINYDLLIWSGGVQPNEVLNTFALPKDQRGRIRVLPNLQVEGHPNVFAIGDGASVKDVRTDVQAPAAAWAAIGQAQLLARELTSGQFERRYRLPKRFPGIVNVGGKYAVGNVRGVPFSGFFAFVVRCFVDLNYLVKIFPIGKALSLWIQSNRLFSNND